MDENEIIEEILAGATREERSEDLLFLCTTMALGLYRTARQQAEKQGTAWPLIPSTGARIYRAGLELSGKILCPIFDYVKPADYIAEMIRTRMEYRGIASDSKLQYTYGERLEGLLPDGQLSSLEVAIEGKVWAHLRPSEGGRYR